MDVGYKVGIIVAVAIIISGCAAIVVAKKNHKKSKWGMWAILAGIVALISAVINYNLFN